MVDFGALATVGGGLVTGLVAWTNSRRTNRRQDFRTIVARLDQELGTERQQRKLLTSYVVDLMRWARRVEPDTQAGPVPDPPADLDLSPWEAQS